MTISEAEPEIVPLYVVAPERAVLPVPLSHTARHGTSAHAVALTPALPMDARMLTVFDTLPGEAAHYRRVLLTILDPNRRRRKVTLTQDDDDDDEEAASSRYY